MTFDSYDESLGSDFLDWLYDLIGKFRSKEISWF